MGRGATQRPETTTASGRRRANRPGVAAPFVALVLSLMLPASGWALRLDGNCFVSVLNRTARVNADGSWILPNVPANFGLVRARATCVVGGVTFSGQSAPFLVPRSGIISVGDIRFDVFAPIPTALHVSASS